MENLKQVIVIAGPTASGKSYISMEVAKRMNGEIISADSMQIYKYMDIGTAKVSEQEQRDVKHHLIDVVTPDESFSVSDYKKMATEKIEQIHCRGKVPIIAGGTGFYINALIYNTEFEEHKEDLKYRNELEEYAMLYGNEALHKLLEEIDEESAEKIHYNNVRRVIRALEYYKLTGEKISEHNARESVKDLAYDTKFIVLESNRETLYERINKRVDKMVADGLEDEVKFLLSKGYSKDLTSMQGIGYKEFVSYFDGEISFAQAVDLIKQNSRRYAKRQVTWFKNQNDGYWLSYDNVDQSEAVVNKILEL